MSENQGMYYTPKEIIDPAAGTGAYLKNAADMLVSNPPYAAQHSVHLTFALCAMAKALFVSVFILKTAKPAMARANAGNANRSAALAPKSCII